MDEKGKTVTGGGETRAPFTKKLWGGPVGNKNQGQRRFYRDWAKTKGKKRKYSAKRGDIFFDMTNSLSKGSGNAGGNTAG